MIYGNDDSNGFVIYAILLSWLAALLVRRAALRPQTIAHKTLKGKSAKSCQDFRIIFVRIILFIYFFGAVYNFSGIVR